MESFRVVSGGVLVEIEILASGEGYHQKDSATD